MNKVPSQYLPRLEELLLGNLDKILTIPATFSRIGKILPNCHQKLIDWLVSDINRFVTFIPNSMWLKEIIEVYPTYQKELEDKSLEIYGQPVFSLQNQLSGNPEIYAQYAAAFKNIGLVLLGFDSKATDDKNESDAKNRLNNVSDIVNFDVICYYFNSLQSSAQKTFQQNKFAKLVVDNPNEFHRLINITNSKSIFSRSRKIESLLEWAPEYSDKIKKLG